MTAQALHCSHRWLTRRPPVSACTVVSCRCLFARPRRTTHPANKRASLADGRTRGMVDLHAQRMATTDRSTTPTIAIEP